MSHDVKSFHELRFKKQRIERLGLSLFVELTNGTYTSFQALTEALSKLDKPDTIHLLAEIESYFEDAYSNFTAQNAPDEVLLHSRAIQTHISHIRLLAEQSEEA